MAQAHFRCECGAAAERPVRFDGSGLLAWTCHECGLPSVASVPARDPAGGRYAPPQAESASAVVEAEDDGEARRAASWRFRHGFAWRAAA